MIDHDQIVGAVLQKLDDLGIADNTIVLVKAAQYVKDGVRLYPLSQAANPPKQKFIDPSIEQLRFPSLPFYDLSAFELLHKIINTEPILPRDKVMMDMLASIGIEKCKPFNPDAKTKKAMETAVADAYFYMLQANAQAR